MGVEEEEKTEWSQDKVFHGQANVAFDEDDHVE